MKPQRHELKTWPPYFGAVLDGSKRFEVRKDDRGFCDGDVLRLREWDPETMLYTGRVVDVLVCRVFAHDDGVAPGYVVMSIGHPVFPRKDDDR